MTTEETTMESERQSRGISGISRAFLIIVALIGFDPDTATRAADVSKSDTATADRVQALIPDIEAYIASGMRGFDVPGLALGIVAGDKLIYAKGFGVRSKSGGMPVDTRTIFQIGSNAKAFLAATEAIMVDRGKLRWDDRVVDLDPEFQLKDPWVTREFRVFDLLAQRSGLPPFVCAMSNRCRVSERPLPTPTSRSFWPAGSLRRPRMRRIGIQCFGRNCLIH
jgi:CubicO group peptidase (beta-lactamase class C family)